MQFSRIFAVPLFVGISLLMSYEAAAQARNSAAMKDVERKSQGATLIDLESWLRSLKGTYRTQISSTRAAELNCDTYSAPSGPCLQWKDFPSRGAPGTGGPFYGFAECYGFGEGPGARCFFKSDLIPVPGEPMVVLFGLQTDHPAIQVLSVDRVGYAHEAQGSLTKQTLTLNTQCPPEHNCARILRIEIKNDGQIVDILFSRGRIPLFPGSEPRANARVEMRRIHPSNDATSTKVHEK